MALNDPNWGKRGNEGPPDLDELWRRLNQKLGSLFGGKGGGNVPQGPSARQMGGGFGLLIDHGAAGVARQRLLHR